MGHNLIQSLKVRNRGNRKDDYPYNVELLQDVDMDIDLSAQVTIFAGENGSGKSTLLEIIGDLVGLNIDSGSANHIPDRQLLDNLDYDNFRLVWKLKSNKGFFLNAEHFSNFTRYIDNDSGMNYPFEFHKLSHGQTFMKTFERLDSGVIILDEPEAALSFQSQLNLISRIYYLTKDNPDIQFIISTHSPILLTIPEAVIYNIASSSVTLTELEELESFNLYKDYLNNYSRFQYYMFKE